MVLILDRLRFGNAYMLPYLWFELARTKTGKSEPSADLSDVVQFEFALFLLGAVVLSNNNLLSIASNYWAMKR